MISRMFARLAGAAAVALLLSPLVAVAQSPAGPQAAPNVCTRACTVEYDNAQRACDRASANDRDACVNEADGAFKTCMAICPANRK